MAWPVLSSGQSREAAGTWSLATRLMLRNCWLRSARSWCRGHDF